jgi:predicted phosphohydrolase
MLIVLSLQNQNLDYKILKRENERLKLAVKSGVEQFGADKEIVAFLHYPPFFRESVSGEIDFIETMKKCGVHKCFYGHLHGESHKDAFEGELNGITFELVSSDYLGFKLKRI